MSKNEIYLELVNEILDILPELSKEDLSKDVSLKDIGANSVDRMDIIIGTMGKLGVKISLVEFGNAHCIDDIVNTIYEGKE